VLDVLTQPYPTVVKLWVDGGYTGLMRSIADAYDLTLEVVSKQPDQHTFVVLPRR
jgi:hypothetical protein